MDVASVVASWERSGPDTVVQMATPIVDALDQTSDEDVAAFAGAMHRFCTHEHSALRALALRTVGMAEARGVSVEPTRTGLDAGERRSFEALDGPYEVFSVAQWTARVLSDHGVHDWDALLEEQDVWFGQLIEGLHGALPEQAARNLHTVVETAPGDLGALCRIVDEVVGAQTVGTEVLGMRAGLHLLREGALEGAYGEAAYRWVPAVVNGVMLSLPATMHELMVTRITGAIGQIAGMEE